jgi:hypothetical protein
MPSPGKRICVVHIDRAQDHVQDHAKVVAHEWSIPTAVNPLLAHTDMPVDALWNYMGLFSLR